MYKGWMTAFVDRRRPGPGRTWIGAALLLSLAACGDPVTVGEGSVLDVTLNGLRPVDPAQGSLRLWLTTGNDTVDAGAVGTPDGEGTVRLTVDVTVPGVRGLLVTLESPADHDPRPSNARLLSGSLRDGSATLAIEGVVTAGPGLEPDPGAHSLFTTSNNTEFGYPSLEDAGLWLFTLRPGDNKHGSREVRVTPLRPGWTYEGWAVYRLGTPQAVWVSYGKYRPEFNGLLSSRDDTGSGPFSGDEDYLNAGVEDVPGEEWTTDRVAAELGLALPEGAVLPFDLDAVDEGTGEALWHHVITIEPAFDEGEPLYGGVPFLLRPYRNPIGEGGPGDPRVIEMVEDPPSGNARAR